MKVEHVKEKKSNLETKVHLYKSNRREGGVEIRIDFINKFCDAFL